MTRAPCRNHMASYGVDVSIVSNFRTCRCETKEEISMRNQKIYEWERTLCSIWGAVNRIAAYARRSRRRWGAGSRRRWRHGYQRWLRDSKEEGGRARTPRGRHRRGPAGGLRDGAGESGGGLAAPTASVLPATAWQPRGGGRPALALSRNGWGCRE